MYNKLFTKILDSSIWLAPDPHRLVWITLIAAMDEDGNAMFACADNLAARARVSVKQAEAAIKTFEEPDPKSGDPENEGRRIERFPGGWKVLNAHKYRALVTKAIAREQTRERVARWRAKKGNAGVTPSNETVTPSEALALSEAKKREEARASRSATHLPAEFDLTQERRSAAEKENLDPERTFANFCDYWRAASGAKARKRDWDATWRVWCRNDKGNGNGTHKQLNKPRPSAVERVYAATDAWLIEQQQGGRGVEGND
jgi:hypothetical protein